MALCPHDVGAVDAHYRGAEDDQQDAGCEAHSQSPDRARRGKAAPEDAQHDDWKIRAGRDGKCQADQKRNVDGLELNRQEDGEGADHEGRDAGDPDFLAGRTLCAVMDNVGVEIMRERGAR